jgi:hypothetical protein
MKQTITTIFLIFSLFIFPGCYRYISWGESVVDQGDKIETCACAVQPYIRSARVYDQFTTLGLFDALLLHDEVIQAYACSYAAKNCLSNDQYHQFLQKQYDEQSSYISFYLLAVVPGNIGVLLTDENPQWTVQLRVGNNCFKPAKLKLVELSHEYRFFFGKNLTVFKKQYLVQFDAYDVYNNPLISPVTGPIELVFSRVGHQKSMVWCLDSQLKVVESCSLQDDTLAYDLNTNL